MSDMNAGKADVQKSEIVVRRYDFQLHDALKGDWNGGDRFRTILANALSIPLPSGERLFIKAVRFYLDVVKLPCLKESVSLFSKQEALHTKEHAVYNKYICDHRGYDLELLEAPYKNYNEYIALHADPLLLLATTVCMEHLTAVASHLAITDPRWIGDADESVRNFWLWHSLEEIEHKAVAFDVFMDISGDKSYLDEIMRATVKQLCRNLSYTACQMHMMEGGRPKEIRKWLHEAPILHGDGGLLELFSGYIEEFYQPDFHPWSHDNSALIPGLAARLDNAFS